MRLFVNCTFCVIVIFAISCTHQIEKQKDSNCKIIRPLESTISTVSFDSIIDTVCIIPLEAAKGSFITDISKIILTSDKKFIILNTSSILVFNSVGQFLFKIGNMGNGPGEYMKIYDICLGKNEKYIYALDCYNRVFKYSLHDGTFDKKIDPVGVKGKRTCDGICSSDNDGFFLFCSNPVDYRNFKDDFYCLSKYDKDGKLIDELLLRNDFCLTPQRFTQTFDKCSFIRPLEGDNNILYKVKNGKLIPVYHIDFGEKSIPVKFIYDYKGNVARHIPEFIKSPYFKLPIGFQDTQNSIYFKCVGPEGFTYEFLLNKKDLKGINWSHSDKIPFNFYCSDSIYYYGIYNCTEISPDNRNVNKYVNPLKEYIIKKLDLYPIPIDANPSIVQVKFK